MTENVLKNLGSNLRALREDRKWSRETAAERYEIATETLARFERGQHNPSLPVALRISQTMGVSIEALLGVVPEKKEGKSLAMEARLARLNEKQLAFAEELLAVLERPES